MNKLQNTEPTPFITVAINTADLISKPKTNIKNNEQITIDIVCAINSITNCLTYFTITYLFSFLLDFYDNLVFQYRFVLLFFRQQVQIKN